MGTIADLTAVEQVAALRRRELSPVELAGHYLERIERHDRTLGAFITVTDELARKQATAAADRFAHEDPDGLPPLLGLPLGIKDLHATAGVRTTFGSAALRDVVPAADAWTVGRLRAAGITLLGKTNAPEFGPTCYTDNDLAPPAVTPWDLTRSASGSSGGAAAAVAAGLMPVGHGSDGAGSTRTPAAACGLVGVKPSRGTVSLYPSVSYLQLGIEGPLARTVADAALLLDVMADPPPGEVWPNPLPTGAGSLSAGLTAPLPHRLRIAMFTDPGLPGVLAHPDAVAGVARAAALLERLGHEVVPIEHPAPLDDDGIEALKAKIAVGLALTVATAVPVAAHPLLRPLTRLYVAEARALSAVGSLRAEARLAAVAARFLSAVAPYDAVLAPSANGPAVPLGYYGEEATDESRRAMLGWSCYTVQANLSGCCAVSLPLHETADGLPIGVQLMARPGADHRLLRLSAELEAAQPWADRTPPIWGES